MKSRGRRRQRWFGTVLFGAAVGLGHASSAVYAEELLHERGSTANVSVLPPTNGYAPASPAVAAPSFSCGGVPVCDPTAPAWCDPISRVPNFFGSFFARGIRTSTNRTLTFTGGGEGFFGEESDFVIFPDGPVTGPGGPYTLTTEIQGNGPLPFVPALENTELTGLVNANFPGATFVDGILDLSGENFPRPFILNYLNPGAVLNLPNPSDGGAVGRNKYFENGSPVPRDRVYFFYNHVGGFQGLSRSFDLNRYVFGAEKTCFDGRASVEVRVPFAGTANSDQVQAQDLAVDNVEFGNIGLLVKAALYRTPNCIATVGLGISAPTADETRLLLAGNPIIVIQNEAWILQPVLGVAWAPNDRFYAQAGLQLDFDPEGNPVQAAIVGGNLSGIGVLKDQNYLFLSGAMGYWIYQGDCGAVSGVALQGELHYDRSYGSSDSVQVGGVTVADLSSDIKVLTATAGLIFEFGERTNLSVGASVPVDGDRLYDWNLIAQFNYQFGGPR